LQSVELINKNKAFEVIWTGFIWFLTTTESKKTNFQLFFNSIRCLMLGKGILLL
jgi:hypothetical protein